MFLIDEFGFFGVYTLLDRWRRACLQHPFELARADGYDKKPVGWNELAQSLASFQHTNENLRVFISGDQDARHGDVIHVLDVVRGAGIQKVAFEIREAAK